jgi:DNA replication protein DnaC
LYENASVDNFVLPDDNPIARSQLAKVLLDVKAYIRNYPVLPKPGLLFIGWPGTGKTHLAVAALRALVSRGFQGTFYDFQSLLYSIRAGYNEASGASEREAYRIALDAEVLLLDDLGSQRISDWVEDTVTSIVTHRCNSRKATIVTTNLWDDATGHSRPDRSNTKPEGGLQGNLTEKLQNEVYSKYTLEEKIGKRARSRLFEMCKAIAMPVVEDYRMKKR